MLLALSGVSETCGSNGKYLQCHFFRHSSSGRDLAVKGFYYYSNSRLAIARLHYCVQDCTTAPSSQYGMKEPALAKNAALRAHKPRLDALPC